MKFQYVITMLFMTCASAAQALTGGEGITKRASELDGYIGISGGCSGVLLTNEWVFTAAHCFKVLNGDGTRLLDRDGNWKKYEIWVGGHEQRSTKFEVDNNQSFQATNPSDTRLDIRLMKLKRPVPINGLTTGYVNRVKTDNSFPESLIGRDLTVDSPFMEIGAGGNEQGSGNLRRCYENRFAGEGSHRGFKTLKFDHDETAGTFPVDDPHGVACDYRAGDSGSATLYREPETGEQFVVGGCPGFAEGGCVAASEFSDFALETVWQGSMPAGLSVEDPRIKPGETVTIHYDAGVRTDMGFEIRIMSATCDNVGKTACRTLNEGPDVPMAKGVYNYRVPASLRGRYQVRFYNGDELLRVVAFHTGGAIKMRSADAYDGGKVTMSFPGLASGTKYLLFLTDRRNGNAPRELGQLNALAHSKLIRQSANWVIDPDMQHDENFVLDLAKVAAKPGTDLDVILIDHDTQTVLDFDVLRILDADVWIPSPRGFDPKDGLVLHVAGNASLGLPLAIILKKEGASRPTTAWVLAYPKSNSSPYRFRAEPEALKNAGITPGTWTILAATLSRLRPDTKNASLENAGVFLYGSGKDVRRQLYFSDVTSDLNNEQTDADFGRVTVNATTTHPKERNRREIEAGTAIDDGLIFSAWTGMPGYELDQAVCDLTDYATRTCTEAVQLDLSEHLMEEDCFELRVHYQKYRTRKMKGDPDRRADINPYAMLAQRTICK